MERVNMLSETLEKKLMWLKQVITRVSDDEFKEAGKFEEIARLLCDIEFLEVIRQHLKTSQAIEGLLKQCLGILPERYKANNPKLLNMSKYLEEFSECLDIYNSGRLDEKACCSECGKNSIIHGHIDRGGVDYYDNYISWCTNCFWAWYREDYSQSGSEGPIAIFDYKTNTYY
jgi:hypothetical protein